MKNKRGVAFIILFLVVVAIAAAAFYRIIMRGVWYHSISGYEEAFYIADSGIKYYVKNQLASDSDWSDNNAAVSRNFGTGTFTVTPTHASLSATDPAFQGDPASAIILTSLGQLNVAGTNFSRVVRYTVRGTGAAAFDGNSVIYGAGSAQFSHINNGIINGNIYLKGTFTDDKSKKLEINGTVTQNSAQAAIPTVNWNYWQAQAAAEGAGHLITVTSASPTYTFSGSAYNGIYYVYCSNCAAGNAIVNNNNMVFNGTLVANGNITFASANNVTFSPAGTTALKNPAIVAGGSVDIGSGNNIIFNGAVYAYQNIIMGATNNLTLNGGALVFGNDLSADHTNNITLNTGSRTDGSGFNNDGQQGTGNPSLSNFVEVP